VITITSTGGTVSARSIGMVAMTAVGLATRHGATVRVAVDLDAVVISPARWQLEEQQSLLDDSRPDDFDRLVRAVHNLHPSTRKASHAAPLP
jgi:hypothetical protein